MYFLKMLLSIILFLISGCLAAFGADWLGRNLFGSYSMGIEVFLGIFLLVVIVLGRLQGLKQNSPSDALKRYLPFIIVICAGAVAVGVLQFLEWDDSYELPILSLIFVTGMGMVFAHALAFASGARPSPAGNGRKASVAFMGMIAVSSVFLFWSWHDRQSHMFVAQGEPSVGHGVDIYDYLYDRDALPTLGYQASLSITEDHPQLDGAIAMFPYYAAVAMTVYDGVDRSNLWDYVDCVNTPRAYELLAEEKIDIFFGLPPSDAQREYIESRGLTLSITPIAREAFVFLAHRENPVNNLSLDQIRSIYAKELTNWKEAGGHDAAILAFQRPEGSGSQTTMTELMRGKKLARPLKEEVHEGMGDLVNQVAAYRNRLNSIGYSFRWYATVQYSHPDIKLLAVDGVAPTQENIANGTYPLAIDFVAVTAKPRTGQIGKLLEWITGNEGQELMHILGYVPVTGVSETGLSPSTNAEY